MHCAELRIAELVRSAFDKSDSDFEPFDIKAVEQQLCKLNGNPCANGGTCHLTLEEGIGYSCTCPTGFTGLNCESGLFRIFSHHLACFACHCTNRDRCSLHQDSKYSDACTLCLVGKLVPTLFVLQPSRLMRTTV